MKSAILFLILFCFSTVVTAQKAQDIPLLKPQKTFDLDSLEWIFKNTPSPFSFARVLLFSHNVLTYHAGEPEKDTFSMIIATISGSEFNGALHNFSFGNIYYGYFEFDNKTVLVSGDKATVSQFFSTTDSIKSFEFKDDIYPLTDMHGKFIPIRVGYLISSGIYQRAKMLRGYPSL